MNRLYVSLVLLALAATAQECSTRCVHVSAGTSACAAACPTPVTFRSLVPSMPVSYACSASTASGQVIGYQLSSEPTICNIVSGGQAVASDNYSCVCEDPAATQGLDLPGASGGCSDSCAVAIDGEPGSPLTQGAAHACLAATERGAGNRFGTQSAPGSCSYAAEGAAQTSADFSCVCLFSAAAGRSSRLSGSQVRPAVEAAG